MENKLSNCWEIECCGREMGSHNVEELGECIASVEGMGHSCWAIAGTLCGGEVQGTYAQKKGLCSFCEVYKLYSRVKGTKRQEVIEFYPEEHAKYSALMIKNSQAA